MPYALFLITGIGNTKPLVDYVTHNYTLVKHLAFNDHHRYTENDINTLITMRNSNPGISFLTTEKDKVKLNDPKFQKLSTGLPLFYLPIEIDFVKGGKDFDEIVLNMIQRAQ